MNIKAFIRAEHNETFMDQITIKDVIVLRESTHSNGFTALYAARGQLYMYTFSADLDGYEMHVSDSLTDTINESISRENAFHKWGIEDAKALNPYKPGTGNNRIYESLYVL